MTITRSPRRLGVTLPELGPGDRGADPLRIEELKKLWVVEWTDERGRVRCKVTAWRDRVERLVNAQADKGRAVEVQEFTRAESSIKFYGPEVTP